jgi:hypothetical protein
MKRNKKKEKRKYEREKGDCNIKNKAKLVEER